jgi:hypothetical protein
VCGKPLHVGTGGLAVLSSGSGPVVAVSLGGLGLAVREAPGVWSRLADEQLRDLAASGPSPSPPRRDLPFGAHPLEPVELPEPVPPSEQSSPAPSYPTPSRPPCDQPVAVTVTPDPRNGQPSVDLRCPSTPS